MHLKASAFMLTIALAMGMSACGGDERAEPGVPPPDRVEGVILDIQAERLDQVEGFTLKSGDDTYEILIDPQREYGFNLGHLHEHLANSEPVAVDLEERNGALYALTIEDS